MEVLNCVQCEGTLDKGHYIKCPMCHRLACEDCAYRRGGKAFCHAGCADEFFFGAEDDDT